MKKKSESQRIGFPYLVVLLPNLVVLLALVVGLTLYVARLSGNRLQDTAEHLATRLNYALVRELGRLESVGAQEDTLRLLRWGRSNRSTLLGQMQSLSVRWAELGAGDREVRMIVGNTCAATLRRLCQSDPALEQVMVVDDAGVVLAAAYRPARPYVGDEAWFESTRGRPRVRLTVADLRNKQRRSVVVPLITEDGGLTGLVRGDVSMSRLLGPEDLAVVEGLGRFWAVGLVGAGPVLLAGRESDYTLFVGRYMDRYGLKVVGGMMGGYGRRGVVVPLSLAAGDSAEVGLAIVARGGSGGWWAVLPAAVLIAGLIFLWALKKLLDWWLVGGFVEPYSELLEAGRWAIEKALHKPVELTGVLAAHLGRRKGAGAAVRHRLEEWLGGIRRAAEDELAAHTAEMQRDLQLAREFQMAYLERPAPQVPVVHVEGRLRLVFHHIYHPALALGGDFFDILSLGPDAAGILIADVMGHGTRSALITAMLRTLVGDLSSLGRNARHFLTELNRQFCEVLKAIPSPLFASAFYFVADTTARVGTYSSAGHPSPFHVRRSVGRISRLEVPEPHGAALGLIPEEKYTGGHVRLIDGDLFLFFTDGVYEARNSRGEEFGIERLESVLRSTLYHGGEQILRQIYDSVLQFVGDEPVADDICMVAVEITTSAAEPKESGG